MAANMKAVKLRIKSVESTMQITKAMELVASSKLRKAKERADTCRPYFQELYRTLQDIAKGNTEFYSIYAKEAKNEKCCYVLVAGDRGLAGGYNANLFRCFEADAKGKEICVVPVGKKAVEYAKSRKLDILTDSFAEIANLSVADSFEIARALCREFRKGTFGHVELCYTKFVSMLSQMPVSVPILPLIDKYENFDKLTIAMLNEFIEKILVHERDRKGSIQTTQEVEIYFNFVGRFVPPAFGEVELTPEELEEIRKREERKDRLHQNYLKRKANGKQKEYEERTKAKKKAEIEARKQAIRTEDIARGVFIPVSSLPQLGPRKGA